MFKTEKNVVGNTNLMDLMDNPTFNPTINKIGKPNHLDTVDLEEEKASSNNNKQFIEEVDNFLLND